MTRIQRWRAPERPLLVEHPLKISRNPCCTMVCGMRLLGALIVAAFLTPAGTAGESFSGKVVGISDGDTIRVMHDGSAERVRLWGIDCPESHQAFGTRAKQFTGDLAFGKDVKVLVRDVDRYGRTVGEVILPDQRSLNRELVRAGLAWWYRQYARGDRELERLEAAARTARRGLWADAHPVPPWEWGRVDLRPGCVRNERDLPNSPDGPETVLFSQTPCSAGNAWRTLMAACTRAIVTLRDSDRAVSDLYVSIQSDAQSRNFTRFGLTSR